MTTLPQTAAETAAADAPASASVPRGRYALWALVAVHVAASATLAVLIACGVLPEEWLLTLSALIGTQAGLLAIWAVFGPPTLLRGAFGVALGGMLLSGLLLLLRPRWYDEASSVGEFYQTLWNFTGLVAGAMVFVCLRVARRPGIQFREFDPAARSESRLGVPLSLRRILLALLGLESAMLVFSAFPGQTYFASCSLAHALVIALVTLVGFTAAVARGNIVLRLLLVPIGLLACFLVVMALGPRSTWHLWYFWHWWDWRFPWNLNLPASGAVLLSLSGVVFGSVWLVERCGYRLSHDAVQGAASPAPARWRYSLRDCLLLLLVLGVALGLFKLKLDWALAQKRAVAEIVAQGGRVDSAGMFVPAKDLPSRIVTDSDGDDFFCVKFYLDMRSYAHSIDYTKEKPEGPLRLAALKDLPHLRSIYLDECQVHDEELRHLANCPALTDLDLYDTPITDEGLRHLANCRELKRLNLSETSVSDEGLASLEPLSQLTKLSVHNTHVTQQGIAGLASLPELSWLWVDGDCITIDELRAFPSLEGVRVHGPHVDDETLRLLARLTKIKSVSVRSAYVTDVGLMRLAAMPRLEEVDVSQTLVTNAGLQRLRNARPDLEVFPKHVPDAPEERSALAALLQCCFCNNGPNKSVYVTGLLGYENFGDDDCRHLAQLKKLQVLTLSETKVTDAGLVHLENLTALRFLNLDDTAITDAGLVHLKKLTGLKLLLVRGTGVTPAGVNKLRKSLPGCTITGP